MRRFSRRLFLVVSFPFAFVGSCLFGEWREFPGLFRLLWDDTKK